MYTLQPQLACYSYMLQVAVYYLQVISYSTFMQLGSYKTVRTTEQSCGSNFQQSS